MAKAVLELPEMPQNCWQCELYSAANNCCTVIVIVGHYAICPDKGRRADCPLKLVEENKLISTIDKIEKVDGIDNYFLHRNYHSGELELNITFKNDIADSILKNSGIKEIESSAFWE